MEITEICSNLISSLNSGNNSVSNIREKNEKIDIFCKELNQSMKQEFMKSSCISDVIQAILNISITVTQIPAFFSLNFKAIGNFFSVLAFNSIPLAKEEKDIQELINIITYIISIHIPNANEDCWTFWLEVFIEILKIPTFYNLFRGGSDESSYNSVSYIEIDNIFSLIKLLIKFEKISNKELNSTQRSLVLKLFLIFLENSPYSPSPDMINSFFEISNIFSEVELSDDDFSNLLNILNKLIILSPLSFLTNSNSPFNEKILSKIYCHFYDYQTNPSIRKTCSTYLLLYLSTFDFFKQEISRNDSDKWIKRILDIWSIIKKRGKILESSKDFPYLRVDIEFLKKSKDKSVSECLLQYFIKNGNQVNSNSNVILLFTAIGKFEPEIFTQNNWLQILCAISSISIGDSVWSDQQLLSDLYYFISVMVDIIDSKNEWNNIFIFLLKNQPNNQSIYSLLSKILSKQKIDVSVAHKYQNLLWCDKSNVEQYSIERLRCIHVLIYFYGFGNDSRNDCFSTLISLLDSSESFPIEYLRQLSLTICSIISSHSFPLLIKEDDEDQNDFLKIFKKQLESITNEGQIIFDNYENDKIFPICNFITKNLQNKLVKQIYTKKINNEKNELIFRLFLTSNMPLFFTLDDFYDYFQQKFTNKCDFDSFPSYFKFLILITDEIGDENFQKFFKNIEGLFYKITDQYIEHCNAQIQSFLKDNSSMSWSLLNNISYEEFFEDLPLLAEFAYKCTQLKIDANDNFYYLFDDLLSTTVSIPILHLKICSNLLKLHLSEHQKTKIINSIETITTTVLHDLLVPIIDREIFLDELFNVLEYDNSKPIEDLFKVISKYSLTPTMKLRILKIMKSNYEKSNQIFDCFWELNSPFFIKDDYPSIRLQSIDTIISILKLDKISIFDGSQNSTIKFDKKQYFAAFISPFVEEILDENEWNKFKQTIFTAIKTLIQIAAEIPELALDALILIINSFTAHDYSIFTSQCIDSLFSGLSKEIHYSLFLRQFIPMLIQQLEKLTDKLDNYPFELFFYDEPNISKNEAKRLFCEKAAPFVVSYSIANSKQELFNFFTEALKKKPEEIINENVFYIASYLLIKISKDEDQQSLQNLYKQLMSDNLFVSPIPLLSFVSFETDESAIKSSYQKILDENSFTPEFINIRNHVFSLYKKIYEANHEYIKLYYFQQYSLYISILFEKEDIFENKETLYSDILALSANLLKFVSSDKLLPLLVTISLNIPKKFDIEMVSFVKSIEDICAFGNEKFASCLDNFFEKFPDLIDRILIFDFLKERQLESRTPFIEFKRIAETRKLNQESIDFLLAKFIEDSDSFQLINTLPNDMKRTVLNEVYHYAILNPQTLALHLYSDLFLNFIDIHPSPLIIEVNTNSSLLINLLELTRDDDPLINQSALISLQILILKPTFPEFVKDNDFLGMQLEQYKEFVITKPQQFDENSSWICQFTCKYLNEMSEDSLCSAFKCIAAVSSDFCKILFPFLFTECLQSQLFDQIYTEFNQFAEDPEKYFEECKLFIFAFVYLRKIIFTENHADEPNWHLKWFQKQIDFQKIMEVCLKIGDPYSAYQFAEFAHEDIDMSDEPLNRIFAHIGVKDLKNDFSYQFPTTDLFNPKEKLKKSLILYNSKNDVRKMSDTLNEFHLYNALNLMKTVPPEESVESFWRLQKWDVSIDLINSYSKSLFDVMQAFATKNEEAVKRKLNDFDQQFHFDVDSSVFNQLSHLLNAAALQWFHAVSYKDSSKLQKLFPHKIIDLYCRYLEKLKNTSHHFYEIAESTNALNGVFFCILNSMPEISSIFFPDVISNSIENNNIESAQYFITLFHENQKKNPQFANFEQIRVLYSDDPHHASFLLEKNYDQIVLKKGQLESEERRKMFNLRVEFTRASWSSYTNQLSSSQIYGQLKEVIEKCEKNNSVDLMADAEFALAKFHHRQHREICNFFVSTQCSTILGIINHESENLKRIAKHDLINYISIIDHYKELFSQSIIEAISSYMRVLTITSKYDLESIFSTVGIWFNYSYAKYQQFIEEVPDLISTLKSKFTDSLSIKFLPLFPQLASRFANKDESSQKQEFQNLLFQILKSICISNPNECFPVLFQLGNESETIEELIAKITEDSDEIRQNWEQMKSLFESYLRLAEASQNSSNLSSLFGLDRDIFDCITEKKPFVTVITNSKKIGINQFENDVTVLNEITQTLLVKVTGEDGNVYKQIIKGDRNDLRQDAVMHQLFIFFSKLFEKKNYDLSIKKCKVVPLSKKAGVIQFIEGSMSIQNYLYRNDRLNGEIGACTRYYVNGDNIPISEVITQFEEKSGKYHENTLKNKENRKDFIHFFSNLRKIIKPVFHFFFIEKFANTGDWFVARLKYSRSTATNSIAGYILGIGERHLNNILIDEKTGEVTHVDLGVAFDQGNALKITEMMPFRLTNEIIDGMGWMGKDSIFRKACEKSMEILRNNFEYLMNVLEIFISDPLIDWNLVAKNQRDQFLELEPETGNSLENNKKELDESAIISCQRKLEGRETGEKVAIEDQISKLICDATSDENLAMMSSNWFPFL